MHREDLTSQYHDICIPYHKLTFKALTTAGTLRGTEFRNRRMDIPKPQGLRGGYSPFRK